MPLKLVIQSKSKLCTQLITCMHSVNGHSGIEADEFTLKRNNLVEKSQLLEALERAEELAQMGEQHDRDAQEGATIAV